MFGIKNDSVNKWLEEMQTLLSPKKVVLIDGSEAQLNELRKLSCQTGELIKLNQEKLPNCYLQKTSKNDVARTEDRTFICCKNKCDAGPTNNWWNPTEAKKTLFEIAKNSYRGRTMYVIPYSMGLINSKFSKIGIEVTDLVSVVLMMSIMTRVGKEVIEKLGSSDDWVKGLHSSCNVDLENRYICHFPETKEIITLNSAFGGNVLLGKKCFALRIASTIAKNNLETLIREQKETDSDIVMAEHMLILGVKTPYCAETKYICAAFPSSCGKTNLAMLVPPKIFAEKGYKVWCLGDDIAWIRVGSDGRLWAINPENGFFGVAPGTNEKSNPNAMALTRQDTVFSNVVHNLEDNTVWWEGKDDNPPKNAISWDNEIWDPSRGKKGAHPNSRYTSPARNCPCLSNEFYNPLGVPISAIIFGGRRTKLTPLVYESFNWRHGVFLGSSMCSETTAASTGKSGILRHDPMAMLPFCGYNIGDYFRNWLKIGKILGSNAPKIFCVNWFKTDENGKILWPGFGENIRVLDWILHRCEGSLNAKESKIGLIPKIDNINIKNTGLSKRDLEYLLYVDTKLWQDETVHIKEFYKKIGDSLPNELSEELKELETRLHFGNE